jgi:hypothetical protein
MMCRRISEHALMLDMASPQRSCDVEAGGICSSISISTNPRLDSLVWREQSTRNGSNSSSSIIYRIFVDFGNTEL